jgi:hypothetical protein
MPKTDSLAKNAHHLVAFGVISPTHKRTEGRAPVRGSEFT